MTQGSHHGHKEHHWIPTTLFGGLLALLAVAFYGDQIPGRLPQILERHPGYVAALPEETPIAPEKPVPTVDKEDYDRRMNKLANYDPEAEAKAIADANSKAEADYKVAVAEAEAEGKPVPPKPPKIEPKQRYWPVTDAPYPLPGAILPYHRIIAYYGNFYAKGMGVLGEYPEEQMLAMWRKELDRWQKADPDTKVMPAVDYIAITAQLSPGKDGKHRARMPHDQIDKALALAEKIDGIVILEVQAGFSDILTETKSFGDYLKHPKIHIALDPEFAMLRRGAKPGKMVGTVSAKEVNEVAQMLAKIVRENNLPPKVLIIHRYTKLMVSEATEIQPLPEVQMIIDMDGWGPPSKKYATYNAYIYPEPVQFSGFKLFYKNDIKQPGTKLLTPEEVLKLTPQPSFIQYQ